LAAGRLPSLTAACASPTSSLAHAPMHARAPRRCARRGLDPEEPVTSSAYLCCFHDLEITAVFIDDLMQQPDQPDAEFMVVYETRSLRDTRDLLKSTTMDNAYAFADTTSHARLWRILAEHALERLDFVMADKAYVRCADYQVRARTHRGCVGLCVAHAFFVCRCACVCTHRGGVAQRLSKCVCPRVCACVCVGACPQGLSIAQGTCRASTQSQAEGACAGRGRSNACASTHVCMCACVHAWLRIHQCMCACVCMIARAYIQAPEHLEVVG